MPFDLSTAKPIEQKFDLSSAKPVQEVSRGTTNNKGFFGRVAQDISRRGGEYGGSVYQTQKDIGNVLDDPLGAVMATSRIPTRLGGAVAGSAADIIGEGVTSAINVIPDVIKDPVKDAASYLMDTELGQDVSELVGSGVEAYQDWAEGSPELAQDVRDVANIASMAPVLKGAQMSAKALPEVGKNLTVFAKQSPTKQRISQLIKQGSDDVETAAFKLKPKTKLESILRLEAPKVMGDKIAKEAIKQGFDPGVIAAVKGASQSDKIAMRRMTKIMERVKRNALYGQSHRPSDVSGASLIKRLRRVSATNKKAVSSLDNVAKTLKGKAVNIDDALNNFYKSLDDMGINLTDDGARLDFVDSDIWEVTGAENALKRIFARARDLNKQDAYKVHRMKRFIDERVSFGKSTAEGLTGRTEGVIKKFRHDLDVALDNSFPRYDKVNSIYSETRGVIDSIQDVAGKKMNLTGPNADKATGTLLKRLMGNQQSRINLTDSINNLETVANKYGKNFDDNLMRQVLFVDELDRVFKPVARTSFQGQIIQAVDSAAGATVSPKIAGAKAVAKGAEKLRGISEDGAFAAIKALLK